MAEVRCEDLVKRFGAGAPALDRVTLEAHDGELLVLVGPSGCGKSTLLRIVAGLDHADSGRVLIGGRDVTVLAPAERNVAMVFQDYALYPHMTVRRNLEFPLRVRGDAAAARDAKVARIASMLALEALLERLPKELSGGQRQRVAMGRALVREPAVSLLDEPLSNLDARLRSEVRAEIADLQRRTATTMLYVTHDQVEAMTLGQRVAVLDRGVLQQVAAPDELYDSPANAFVAGFLGSPPMNLLPVDSIESGFAIVKGGSRWSLAGIAAGVDASLAATVGIRPEALAPTEAGPGSVAAIVDHVEMLGHETLVHATLAREASATWTAAGTAGPGVIARLPGTHRFEAGSQVSLAPDPGRIHLFAAGGERLC